VIKIAAAAVATAVTAMAVMVGTAAAVANMAIKISSSLMHEPVSRFATKELATLKHDQTIKQAVASLRKQCTHGRIIYFYAVDDKEKLLGVVPVRSLLSCDEESKISEIMVSPVMSIKENATLMQASELFIEHKFMALPVVDAHGRLKGVIDLNLFTDDVNGLSKKQELEKAFQIIGVHVASSRKVSPWLRFKDRFPWLICNITSGIICALIASRYQVMLRELIILALFMTVVLSISESVSIQSMTITLQNLLHSKMSFARLVRLLRRELTTSLMIGIVSALCVFAVSFLWRHDLFVSVVISTSIVVAVSTAGLLGVFIPTVIYSIQADPKIAAGPIVLALVDVTTLLYYFSVARCFFG